MPELPEVETTKNGISPHIIHKTVHEVIVRQPKLRWMIPADLAEKLCNETVLSVERRAKYLLIQFATGTLIIHLGMSGSLRIHLPTDISDSKKHDHVEWKFNDGTIMRYHDPRRFGAVLWYEGAIDFHPLLEKLGPEPLSEDFNAAYLYSKLQKQKRMIKVALIDNHMVVGVGNIYANEALFMSSILPTRTCQNIDMSECELLVNNIKTVLQAAIKAGGSTLRDFVNSDGTSGYFQQQYYVYGKNGQSCQICNDLISNQKIAQRSSFYCPTCQH